MKPKQSEAAFQAGLAERLKAAGETTQKATMHMNSAPTGRSKSLVELVGEANSEGAGSPALGQTPVQTEKGVSNVQVAGGASSTEIIQQIPVQQLRDSPWQPRTRYDETQLQALGETMRERGQDEPIQVRLLDDGYFELISGHRRTRAARMIGWATIEAKVVVADDRKAELLTLVSNELHVGLSEYEKGLAYQQAMERGFASTQEAVARIFGCTQSRVSQCLTILKVPQPFRELLDRYPHLFGFRYAKTISELSQAYPSAIDTIVQGVERLIDNPDLDEGQLKSYVEKALKKRVRASPAKATIVSDRNGAALFSVRTTDRQIVIDFKEDVDAGAASKRTLSALREYGQSVEVDKKEKS